MSRRPNVSPSNHSVLRRDDQRRVSDGDDLGRVGGLGGSADSGHACPCCRNTSNRLGPSDAHRRWWFDTTVRLARQLAAERGLILCKGCEYIVEAAYDGSPTVIVNRSYHSLDRFELVG